MNASVAVVLVLAYALSTPAYAGEDDGSSQRAQRPYYLENNHGQLVPYGVGDLKPENQSPEARRARYFRERALRERWTFGPEGHQRKSLEQARPFSYRDLEPDSHDHRRYAQRGYSEGYRYYLPAFKDGDRGQHPEDFGRFSIRIDEDHEPGSVIYYQLPVSPRFER